MKQIRGLSSSIFYVLAFAAIVVALLSLNAVQARQGQKQFNSPRELIEYLNSYCSNLPRSQADHQILDLIALQVNSQKVLEKQIFSEKTNRKINQLNVQDLSNPSSIHDSAIQTLARQILDNGFRFSTSEGMNYIEINYPWLIKQYGRYVSPAVFGYLQIMSRETDNHFAEDAVLRISPDEVADRMVFMEKYAAQNKSFARMADIQNLYRKYCYAYLLGLNNTPAFDYKTLKLNGSFLKLYQNTIDKYPGTVLASKTAAYLKILKQNNFIRTKPILIFASQASLSILK